jgi:hypothetical protein
MRRKRRERARDVVDMYVNRRGSMVRAALASE